MGPQGAMRNYLNYWLGHVDWLDGGMNPRTTYRLSATLDDPNDDNLKDDLQFLADQLTAGGFTVTGTSTDGPKYFLANKDRVLQVLTAWLNLTNDTIFQQSPYSDQDSPETDPNWPTSDGDLGRERQGKAVLGPLNVKTTLVQQLIFILNVLFEANGGIETVATRAVEAVLKKVLQGTVTQKDIDDLFVLLQRSGAL